MIEQANILNGLGGVQSLGIVNALKTGDPRTDMVVALCLPFALRYIVELGKKLAKYCNKGYWWQWWYGDHAPTIYHERTIAHIFTQNRYGETIDMEEDSHNAILIKAIRLYCHANVDFQLRKADLSLTNMDDGRKNYYYGSSIVNCLSQYKLIKNPPEKQWHKLGVFGGEQDGASLVELSIDSESKDDTDDEQKSRTRRTTFALRSMDGSALDSFLDTAYNWYIDQLRSNEDVSRYYYDLETKASDETESKRYYKRFRLSEEKTFESLFFQEKDSILKLIDDFMEKKGKYGVKGYPHKLGLLLTGPPGTGKTSLIKALAQYTGRSIVNVPLSKISTNAELMSQFFDRAYNVKGQHTCRLDFTDVIFCLEDVDAASDIVKRRDGGKGNEEEDVLITADAAAAVAGEPFMDQVPPNKSLWDYFLESEHETCQELVQQLMEKSSRLKEEAQKTSRLQSVANCISEMRPGLGFVGSDNPTLQKLGQDSIQTSKDKMDTCAQVDAFLSAHAKKMNRLLGSGAAIDDALVDSLLCTDPVFFMPPPSAPFPTSLSTGDLREEAAHMDYRALWKIDPSPSSENSSVDNGDNKKSSQGGGAKKTSNMMLPRSTWYRPPDALNLTGILNALDGVVDCPGRIVIMTTNHPEKLDKALIRPGRIDKKLYLGYMAADDVVNMLEHYFQTSLDDAQRQRVENIMNGYLCEKLVGNSDVAAATMLRYNSKPLQVTPAQVEQLTAEHDTLDDMIDALETKVTTMTSKQQQVIAAAFLSAGTTSNRDDETLIMNASSSDLSSFES